MVFFALAMTVNLPGTVGFVGEDLLVHGLLGKRPFLAAGFVAVVAINAAALYLALVNVIVDVQGRQLGPQPEAPRSVMMKLAAGLSLLIGLVPRPFVASATQVYAEIAPHSSASHH
jgi:NADH-quinone oxidoreductase subunit M